MGYVRSDWRILPIRQDYIDAPAYMINNQLGLQNFINKCMVDR